MYFSFRLFVALRYFFAKKNELLVSFISKVSLVGVMLGVAALIVVMSVMHGFRTELAANIVGLNSDISILSLGRNIKSPRDIEHILKTQEYIKSAIPIVLGQGLAIGPRTSLGVLVKGLYLEDLKSKDRIANNIVFGSLDNFIEKNEIVIGVELAANLGVRVGDHVKLISSQVIS
ncbi:MAG: hypothetical protein RLZZ59_227, partial [Pseudomonadota bacterium]